MTNALSQHLEPRSPNAQLDSVTERSSVFFEQIQFISEQSWRLLTLQDTLASSPSRGCYDLAYWRDKTAEFPNARFQEAGATLLLLSTPCFSRFLSPGSPTATQLYDSFSLGLHNLRNQRYRDGSLDEWYKGERGFAAVSFTACAYALATKLAGTAIENADRAAVLELVETAAEWLCKREDLLKTNHEAVACATLALAYDLTGNPRFRREAERKTELVLAAQTSEGWFPEIRGCDLGYSILLLDYMMIYDLVLQDGRVPLAMNRLVDFLLPHVHPDLTLAAESSICKNTYLTFLGFGLLSPTSPAARALVSAGTAVPATYRSLAPFMGDDLRFARTAYIPLAAYALRELFTSDAPPELPYPPGWTHAPLAGVSAFHAPEVDTYVTTASGGTVRCFVQGAKIYEDLGLQYTAPDGEVLSSLRYDPSTPAERTSLDVAVNCTLIRPKFYYPKFLERLILRLGAVTPWSSRLLRQGIDLYRLRAKTALNQSAGQTHGGNSSVKFTRRVRHGDNSLTVTDTIQSDSATLNCKGVSLLTADALIQQKLGEQLNASTAARGYDIHRTITLTAFPQIEVGIQERS